MASPHWVAALPPKTASLLETGKYSDLILKCQDKSFVVHRAVVCIQSKPFASMVDNFKEGLTGVIELGEENPEIVERVLSFLYSGDYSDTPTAASSAGTTTNGQHDTSMFSTPDVISSSLLINTLVYIFADLWDISALKQLALEKYQAALKIEGSFFASLELMYQLLPESDRMLKDVASEYAQQNIKELINKAEFVALGQNRGDLVLELLQATVAELSSHVDADMQKYRCCCCKRVVRLSRSDNEEPQGCPWCSGLEPMLYRIS